MQKWTRVTKQTPCCCGKTDWCLISKDGSAYLCMRMEGGNQVTLSDGSIAWIHKTGSPVRVEVKPEPPRPTIDAAAIMRDLWRQTTDLMRADYARSLGVSPVAVHDLGASWHPEANAWAWPMFDAGRKVVGIRLRSSTRKWAITGSRQGIFWPKTDPLPTLTLCEGPTDCAAALSLGLFAIGRPSCTGCISYVQVAVNKLGIKRAILVADNDIPGIRGAKQLADELQVPCCNLLLPCKDLRQLVQLGGTRALIDSLTSQLVWHQPR
jgi:hypothetical protein